MCQAPAWSILKHEMAWYDQCRADVDAKYPGQFIAISGDQVVASAGTLDGLGAILSALVGNASVYIVRAGAQERVLKVRSPRVVR